MCDFILSGMFNWNRDSRGDAGQFILVPDGPFRRTSGEAARECFAASAPCQAGQDQAAGQCHRR